MTGQASSRRRYSDAVGDLKLEVAGGSPGRELRFEPTVLGALRRFSYLVAALVLMGALGGFAYNKLVPKTYEGSASLAIPPSQTDMVFGTLSQAGTPSQASNQYVLEQVTLLQSPQVAARAASIVNSRFHGSDVGGSGPGGRMDGADITGGLTVTPPSATVGSQVPTNPATVSFIWSRPSVAAAGANAVLDAYAQVRNQQLQSQVATTTANLQAAISSVNQEILSVDRQLAQLDSQASLQAAQTQQQLQNELNSGLKVAPPVSSGPNPQVQALQAQESSLLNRRTGLQQRLDQINVNEASALAQPVSTIPAVENDTPTNAHLLRYSGLGALIGLILGAVIAYLIAIRRRRFENRFEPEALYGTPLLGDIPNLRRERIHSSLPVATHPGSATAEAFRFIAAGLRVMRAQDGPCVTAFTSARVGAGKTFATANVALALAQSGARVLAIDADFVRQHLCHALLGDGAHTEGLASVLEGSSDVMVAARELPLDSSGTLRVLSGGVGGVRVVGMPQEATVEALRRAKESFDFVLVDGPPLLQAAYATELLACAESVVMVINHHELIRDHPSVLERLEMMGVPLLGYLYNRAPLRAELTSYYYRRRAGDSPIVNLELRGPRSGGEASSVVVAQGEPDAPGTA
jgi:Mrp family chromosome partitioning ATPase